MMKMIEQYVMEQLAEDREYSMEELENMCEGCPYAEQCQAQQLYWGCGIWEAQMGEDL
jgi:hypothetical protein